MATFPVSFFTYEFKDFYKILPSILDEKSLSIMSQGGKKVSKDFSYKSNEQKSNSIEITCLDNYLKSQDHKNFQNQLFQLK